MNKNWSSGYLPVENPVVGEKYHLKWAFSSGCVWKLKEINGDKVVMETPKTKKIITAKKSDLLHLRHAQWRIEHPELYKPH